MRVLRCALALFLLAGAGNAMEIRSYVVRFVISASGHATGTASIAIDGRGDEPVALPLGFAGVTGVRLVSTSPGTHLTAEPFNAQTRIHIEAPPGPAAMSFAFDVADAFTLLEPPAGQKRVVPAGSRILRHTLVNTESPTIHGYRCEVIFPPELRAHAIREALPKPGRKESTPRVLLTAIDTRPGARLQVATLRQGESASMDLELVPQSRSPWWAVAGLLLSALFLFHFRDLVAAPAIDGARPGERQKQEKR